MADPSVRFPVIILQELAITTVQPANHPGFAKQSKNQAAPRETA
ncbi:hypothetical protein [Sulfuriferula plumbiphila]|nr:hypothetical protein [Sulfuriferula plumbiphila]